MEITPELLAWIGMLLGVVARISLPYLRKMWAGDIKAFEIYYIYVGVSGFILSLIVSVLIAPNMLIVEGATFVQTIVTNFIVGFGSTSLINEIFAYNELREKQPASPTT